MKFDVVIGNPPYQELKEGNKKSKPIWHYFVDKSFSICKDDGFVCNIHPSNWRGSGKLYTLASNLLRSKQIEYLEIHDEQDGQKTFKATTRYDWYIARNSPISHDTAIKDQNDIVSKVNLKEVLFIPNALIDKIFSMIAIKNKDRVKILHSFSAYESRKPFMSKTKSGKFIHPVIYSTPVKEPTIWYSSTKDNGHFGVAKLILNPCRPIGFVIDEKGEYGMSQFCVGIVGDSKYLKMVAGVIKNQKTNGFKNLMESLHFDSTIFNKDIISLFRKDFWKEFI